MKTQSKIKPGYWFVIYRGERLLVNFDGKHVWKFGYEQPINCACHKANMDLEKELEWIRKVRVPA